MSDGVSVLDEMGWWERLRSRAYADRIPIHAALELTRQCNLRCCHCYLGNQEEQRRQADRERDTAAVLRSLDEWADAGVLSLLITGGDPMIRRDFPEVYRHAAELGMFVIVFCDGLLVTEKIVRLFREYPPRKVEISIYGATAETYELVTRVPGSHARAWAGIRRLLDAGIRVALKTMLLNVNEHELEAMAVQSKSAGCDFRFDAAVFPCIGDGSAAPLDYRVAPERVVARDLATPERRRRWANAVRNMRERPETDVLYPCCAGATMFHADPEGHLSPCLMAARYRYNPARRAFREVWETDLAEIRGRKRTRSDTSMVGDLRGVCTHCPAFNALETGDEERESDYMKRMVRARYDAVRATSEGSDL